MAHALVSGHRYVEVMRYRWCRTTQGYAGRKVDGRVVLLHRFLLGLEHGDPREGEHENRNRLDCRDGNLRIAERAQADNQQNRGRNARNTSGYRGVTWDKNARKWVAHVGLKGKTHYLGLSDDPAELDVVCKAFRAKHMPFSEDARVLAEEMR